MVTPCKSTSFRRSHRCAPSDMRIPNSRVRPLTEKARTPATPTTEISKATPANPPNTTAFSRPRQYLRAYVLKRARALHRLFRRNLVNGARDGGSQGVRILLRAHQQTALPSLLVGRLVHHHGRRRDDVLVIHIGHHADDPPGLLANADKLHHSVRSAQLAVQRILPGEQRLRQALAHDHHRSECLIEVPESRPSKIGRPRAPKFPGHTERNFARQSSSPFLRAAPEPQRKADIQPRASRQGTLKPVDTCVTAGRRLPGAVPGGKSPTPAPGFAETRSP